MIEAEADCKIGIGGAIRTVHWLHKKMAEAEGFELKRVGVRLREHEFQFMTVCLDEG